MKRSLHSDYVVGIIQFYLKSWNIDFIMFFTGLDIIPFICTVIACLAYSIEFGIIFGIIINVAFVLYNIARPVIHAHDRKVWTSE